MSNYVDIDTVRLCEGHTVGADGVERRVYRVELVIDADQCDRLAGHYAARTDAGRDPMAGECRELASPIMAALVASGCGVDANGNGLTLGTALDINAGV